MLVQSISVLQFFLGVTFLLTVTFRASFSLDIVHDFKNLQIPVCLDMILKQLFIILLKGNVGGYQKKYLSNFKRPCDKNLQCRVISGPYLHTFHAVPNIHKVDTTSLKVRYYLVDYI